MNAFSSMYQTNDFADTLNTALRVDEKKLPRLLLVDDEPRLLMSLCDLLSGRGFQLFTASSGKKALQQLEANQFDLILLDLGLPDIGGHEIMDFINAQKIDANVIVLSGHNGIEAAIGALKRGAYGYLRKPYSPEELLKTVDNAIEKRKLETENSHITWQLECSEKLYRHLIDSSPDIIYTLDHQGQFTFINDRALRILGFRQDELIGKHYSVLVHGEDLERAHYVFNERTFGAPASNNVELRLKCNNSNEGRIFDNTLRTISFNSTGIHGHDHKNGNREFSGTYVVARDITDRRRAEETVSYQARHDILTDLPNRPFFKDQLDLAIQQARRSNTELAVLFIDLDRFKLINDTLGHLKGDLLLQQVADRLKGIQRPGALVARLGSDEFTLLLPSIQHRDDAQHVAEQCVACLHQPFILDNQEVHISASVGIAFYPGDGDGADELVRNADIAMYHVKLKGKNGHGFYDNSMTHAYQLKITQEHDLRRALELNQLEMYYQPQIDVENGNIVGAEGLMRWNHPERGLLTAGEFLPFAEENGLILPISDWMIGAVCRDILNCRLAGCKPLRLALNLSPQYLDRIDFFKKLQEALVRYDICPDQIEVEITENICIRNPQHAIEQLNKLCQLGVSVAIDDFGTGYSSLAYLHRFPIHTLKIDQSFVKEIQDEYRHSPVILAIISIARGLGINLIAEGVETDIQARYLEKAGCKIMQGYLFHRPIPLQRLISLLPPKSANSPDS
jgi:diguanylate cyclase (GGDEF)-like protein/PAS domain S-box-containing protein